MEDYLNQSKKNYQNSLDSATINSQNSQSFYEYSGISSLITTRNIIKFFSKNTEELSTSRIASFLSSFSQQQPKFKSPFHPDEINKQFGRYTDSIAQHIQKHKARCLKYAKMSESANKKELEREQLQTEIKIRKIPEQYFKQQVSFQQQSKTNNNDIDGSNGEPILICKSKKLHQLLQIEHSQNKKQSKSKQIPLSKRQQDLEEYLDQIELLLFNKTKKYPDKYLCYLENWRNVDATISTLLDKLNHVREILKANISIVSDKYCCIKKLESKKRKIMELLELMKIMRFVRNFKKQQSTLGDSASSAQGNEIAKQKLKSSELIALIQQFPKLAQLHKLLSISLTLNNIEQLGRNMKMKKMEQLCKLLRKNLTESLSSMYSRELWLKSEQPKDALMIHRMRAEVQATLQSSDEANMNNSLMNISVLDQSYCVGHHSVSPKNEASVLGMGKQVKEIVKSWKEYCHEYYCEGYKFEEENQQISEILQRSLLKFTNLFERDFEDYALLIFSQKFINTAFFPTHKDRICYIQPKFFNKVIKIYFQALSKTLTYAQSFTHLSPTYLKLTKIVEQKIVGIITMRSITDYSLIENSVLSYEDVAELLSAFDYWFEYSMEVIDRAEMLEGDGQLGYVSSSMMEFQQSLHKAKQKLIDEFLSNLHKFSLVSDLKSAVQKQDFSSISIPVSSFSVLDLIINWGQSQPTDLFFCHNNNEAQESFSFAQEILSDLQSQPKQKKHSRFSIFKVIDKKLIIQGKQYRICHSLILLSLYLGTYLKAKVNFPLSAVSMDERICQLIGFYIWYSKKMVFTVEKSDTRNERLNSNVSYNVSNVTLSKGIVGIKSAINGVYKEISNEFHSEKRQINQQVQNSPTKTKAEIAMINKKTVSNLCMIGNLCQLLLKFIDILNITSKQKKVEKVMSDLLAIKNECEKQLSMVAYLEIEKEVSCLYESKLKTRKEIPTSETVRVMQIVQKTRNDLEEYHHSRDDVKKLMHNTMRTVSKNYFGYLYNMDSRGRSELKWFIPKLKEAVGDLFPDEVLNLQKQLRL